MKRNAMRSGGSVRFCPLVAGAAESDSSHGSDIAAPIPRKSLLLEMGLNIERRLAVSCD
jgi:hypothetical protein